MVPKENEQEYDIGTLSKLKSSQKCYPWYYLSTNIGGNLAENNKLHTKQVQFSSVTELMFHTAL